MWVALTLASVLVQPAFAIGRATKEQMAKHTKDADKLWDAPASNYSAICAYVIKPGVLSRDDLLKRLLLMLAKANREEDKAALHYLTGETYYWGGLAELKETRKKSAVLKVGDNVAGSFLAAWEAIGKAQQSLESTKLRNTITIRFNQLLGTSVCGGNLSTNLKQEVITRYIDRLDATDQATAAWPLLLRGKVFANLGIQTRMAAEVPSAMPTNFFGVCEAMNLAWCAGATNDALRIASALEETYEPDLAKWPQKHREVFSIYKACGDKRAWPCIQALTTNDPTAWLELYDFSVHQDPHVTVEQRRDYMDNYLKRVEAKSCQGMGVYRAALDKLVANGDYELAIQIADQALNDEGMARMTEQSALVWRLKAIAHEKRGERDKAAEADRKGLELESMVEGEDVKQMFRKGLNRVQDQEENKGAK
jgi:tetratricopeptide (TPR) repeat protein